MKQANMLITGATGNIGTILTQQLSAQGIPFRAMVKTTNDAARALHALPGAEAVIADFNDPGSIAKALQGVEKVFLLTSSSEQTEKWQKDFVAVAKENGVQHIVKLSQLHANVTSPVRFLRYHAAVENSIRDSGMDYTFLRPNLFMQGLLGFRDPIVHQGKFFATAGDAPISLVDPRDIAAVAALALTTPGHAGKIYDITGPESLTHAELAAKLSTALGRPISYVNVTSEQLLQALSQVGFPLWQAEGLIEDYAHYARGEAAAISPVVQQLTGHAPRSFDAFLQDYAAMLA